MKRKSKIEEIIKQNINFEYYKIDDVSESHRGHSGFVEGQETHINILIVSDDFKNLNRVARQRLLNELLFEEFKNGLHAVSYSLFSKEEYKSGYF